MKIFGFISAAPKELLRHLCLGVAFFCVACSGEYQTIERASYVQAQSFLEPQIINEQCKGDETPEAYRLGAKDTFKLGIFNEPSLSGKYTLDKIGSVDMPLIGSLKIAGCTLQQVEKILFDKYTDGYLIDPSISLEMDTYRPFYIIGEVRAPGKYEYSAGMNVLKAVAMAEGYTYRANKNVADILRRTQDNAVIYEAQGLQSDIRPGDVILIKERLF